LSTADDDDPRWPSIGHEMTELENRIVATPATTRRDLQAKQRFIRRWKFVTDDGCETGDLGELVEIILEMDIERVAAGKTRTRAARPQAMAGALAAEGR
jgi:hypothetical protein